MLVNHLFESSHGAAAGVETIRQLLHAVKDKKNIDLKVGPEMFPVEYGDARYLLQWWKANRHLGDAVAKYYGDANWIEEKLAKRDTVQSPDRLKQFDKERFAESDYKGWKYSSYDEDYGDNRKTSHVATKDGKEVDIDWSPYNRMSDEQFKTWVDLGMPTRKDVDSIGPLQPEDLEALMKTKLGTRARLAQEGEVTELQEDPTPKRRIMDFDNHSRYWSGTGEYQDAYGDLYDQLVPKQGKADTVEGELLRAVGKIIYRHGNDGDNFSHGSYNWIEKHVGKFDHLDDMADKVVLYVLNKKGDYTPNNFDWLTVADYGPGEYEKDWEQVGCNNCGGTGEIEYTNDDGEEDFEECDACDGNGWIEQTTESVEPVTEEKCDCCGNEIVNGECGCGPECPHCGGKPHTKESKVNEASFEITYNDPQFSKPRTHTVKAVNAKSAEQKFLSFGNPYKILDIKKAEKVNEEQYSDFEVMRAIKVAQDHHDDMTHAIEKIDAIKPGLSNHRAVKDELRRQNEDKDDITKKLDPKTRIALKKQQMKTAGVTKGDPIAAMAMGLEKDVKRLDKENDEEEADIAAQELVDKYHSQELDKIKKMLDTLLKR